MQDVTLEMRKKIAEQIDVILRTSGADPKQLLEKIPTDGTAYLLYDMIPKLHPYLTAEKIPPKFLIDNRKYFETHLKQTINELVAAEKRERIGLMATAGNSDYRQALNIFEELKDDVSAIASIGATTESLSVAFEAIEILGSKKDVNGLIMIGSQSEMPLVRKLAQDKLNENKDALLSILDITRKTEDHASIVERFSANDTLDIVLDLGKSSSIRTLFLDRIDDPEQLRLIALTEDFADIPLIAIKRLEEKFPETLDNEFNLAVWNARTTLPEDFVKRSIGRVTDPNLLKEIILNTQGDVFDDEIIRILKERFPDSLQDEQFNMAVHANGRRLPLEFVEASIARIRSNEGLAQIVLDTELPREVRMEKLNLIMSDATTTKDNTTLRQVIYALEERADRKDKTKPRYDPVLSYARGRGLNFGIRWERNNVNAELMAELQKELERNAPYSTIREQEADPEDTQETPVQPFADEITNDDSEDTQETLAEPDIFERTFEEEIIVEQTEEDTVEPKEIVLTNAMKRLLKTTLGLTPEEIEALSPQDAAKKVEEMVSKLNAELTEDTANERKVSYKDAEFITDIHRKIRIQRNIQALETLTKEGVDIFNEINVLVKIARNSEDYIDRQMALTALKYYINNFNCATDEVNQLASEIYLNVNDMGGCPRIAKDILTMMMSPERMIDIEEERNSRLVKNVPPELPEDVVPDTEEPVSSKPIGTPADVSAFDMPWEGTGPIISLPVISMEEKLLRKLNNMSAKELEQHAKGSVYEKVCLEAVEMINNTKRLARIAKEASFESVRKIAEDRIKEIEEATKASRERLTNRLRRFGKNAVMSAMILIVGLTMNGHVAQQITQGNQARAETIQTEKESTTDQETNIKTKKSEQAVVASVFAEQKPEVKPIPEIKPTTTPPKVVDSLDTPNNDDVVSYENEKPFQDVAKKATTEPTTQPSADTTDSNPVPGKEFKLTEMIPSTPELPVNEKEVALLQLQRTIEGSLNSGDYDSLASLFQFKAKTGHEGKWIGWEDGKEDKSISNLQLLLRNVGYDEVQLTGQYDKATEHAVKNLQKTMLRNGITLEFGADGKFGTETWNGLQNHLKNQKNDAKSMLTDYVGFKGKFASNARPGPSMQLNRI